MTQIQPLTKGQADWQETVNAIISEIDGGTVTHIDSPLEWLNSTKGTSEAWVIPLQDYNLVILSITSLSMDGLHTGSWIANLPDNLALVGNEYIRMSLTQNMVVGSTGNTRLDLWGDPATVTSAPGLYGTSIYLSKKATN